MLKVTGRKTGAQRSNRNDADRANQQTQVHIETARGTCC